MNRFIIPLFMLGACASNAADVRLVNDHPKDSAFWLSYELDGEAFTIVNEARIHSGQEVLYENAIVGDSDDGQLDAIYLRCEVTWATDGEPAVAFGIEAGAFDDVRLTLSPDRTLVVVYSQQGGEPTLDYVWGDK